MRRVPAASPYNKDASDGRARFDSESIGHMGRQRHGGVKQELLPANAEKVYRVTARDLPLHCPRPDSYLWNSHPKVFLPIEQTGEAKCPYCSASYELVAEVREA